MADEKPTEEFVWGEGLDQDELAQLRTTKSVTVNRVWVRPYGANVRISLGEAVEGKTYWHSAIMVQASDLIPIAQFLLDQARWTADWVAKQYVPAAKAPGDGE